MNHKTICGMPSTLSKNTNRFLAEGVKTVAHQHQQFFMSHPQGCESGLRKMINGLEDYCRGVYQLTEGEYIAGDDGFLGPYLEEIAHGLRGLLSGLGKFDGGTLDQTILEICETHKLNIE